MARIIADDDPTYGCDLIEVDCDHGVSEGEVDAAHRHRLFFGDVGLGMRGGVTTHFFARWSALRASHKPRPCARRGSDGFGGFSSAFTSGVGRYAPRSWGDGQAVPQVTYPENLRHQGFE